MYERPEIVAWTYEAAMHCPTCAAERFGRDLFNGGAAVDREGNPPHPVFSVYYVESEPEHCDYCHAVIGAWRPVVA